MYPLLIRRLNICMHTVPVNNRQASAVCDTYSGELYASFRPKIRCKLWLLLCMHSPEQVHPSPAKNRALLCLVQLQALPINKVGRLDSA